MTKFPMQAVVVSTFRLPGFRCSKLLRLVFGASSYLLKVFVRSMSMPLPARASKGLACKLMLRSRR